MANPLPVRVEHANSGGSRWSRMVASYGKGHSIGLVVLVIWMIACGIYLIVADSPWESSIVQRLEAGKNLEDEHVRAIAFWWGAVMNFGGAAAIALAAPLWALLVAEPSRFDPRVERRRSVDWGTTVGLLLLVAVAAGVLRAPRLDDSFTNDEEVAWRGNGHGYWRSGSGDGSEFSAVSWTRTLLTNRTGDNHTLQTAVSRGANRLWQQLGKKRERAEFSEMAIRMPMFLAGLGSVVLIGILGALVGNARVGIGAAAMLALSPWHVRYAAEGRGYSLMILLMIIAVLASILAIDRRKLRWWFIFGVCQAAYLLAFPGAIYVAIAHCTVLFVTILVQPGELKRVEVFRFLSAGLLSAMVFFATQFVAISQLAKTLNGTQGTRAQIGMEWVFDACSHLVAGIPWQGASQALQNGMNARQGWDGQPYYVWVLIIVFPVIALIGLGHMAIRGWRERIAVVPVLAGGVIAMVDSMFRGAPFFSREIVYLVIPFSICVSWTADRVAPPRTRHFCWFLLLVLGLYVLTVAEPLHRIGNFQRQPMLQVVESIRGQGHPGNNPTEGNVITATFGTSARQILSYDPMVRFPNTASDLEELIAEANENSKSLVVYFCDQKRAENEWPDLLQRVTGTPQFEQVEVFKGMEAMFQYSVYRWSGIP